MTVYVCPSCNVYVDIAKHVRCLACGVTFQDKAPSEFGTDIFQTSPDVKIPMPACKDGKVYPSFSEDGTLLRNLPQVGEHFYTPYPSCPEKIQEAVVSPEHRPKGVRTWHPWEFGYPSAVAIANERTNVVSE